MPQIAQVLAGRRILVVEDDYLVAQSIIGFLEDAGAEVVGPFGWLEEVLAFLHSASREIDGALLDIDLHGRRSDPIADMLVARSVPFVFTTGYGMDLIEKKYAHYPRFEKPFDTNAVIAALARA